MGASCGADTHPKVARSRALFTAQRFRSAPSAPFIGRRGLKPSLFVLPASDVGLSWFEDHRRLIFWDLNHNGAFVANTATGETREVEGVPGPSELQLSDNDRTLIVTRTVSESDIWLFTMAD